jgi:hypothetical protein
MKKIELSKIQLFELLSKAVSLTKENCNVSETCLGLEIDFDDDYITKSLYEIIENV